MKKRGLGFIRELVILLLLTGFGNEVWCSLYWVKDQERGHSSWNGGVVWGRELNLGPKFLELGHWGVLITSYPNKLIRVGLRKFEKMT